MPRDASEFVVCLALIDRPDCGESMMDDRALEGRVLIWDPDEWGGGARPYVELVEDPTWGDLVAIATRTGIYTGDTVHGFLEQVFEIAHPGEEAWARKVAPEAGLGLDGARIFSFFMGS